MTKLAYTIRFLTPAFLGDAEQSGRWRTPPLKTLLRQWWRVVYAADCNFNVDVAAMRREEGLLFGNAWLENEFCKSRVRLRLDRWESGTLKSWNGLEQSYVTHPEVQRASYKVGPHAYLGYGPLDGRGGTKLNEKVKAVVNVDERATLSIAVPDEYVPRIERVLWLMDRYGTVGGRSRNGWGSFSLLPPGEGWGEGNTVPLRCWHDCLGLDWPHAIGQENGKGPLIWQTAKTYDDWKSLMRDLAIIKIGLRTQFKFVLNEAAKDRFIKKDDPEKGISHGAPQDRHWLAYPVTHHPVSQWGNNARLPNQLRFKVRQDANGKLVGVIFHVPHLPPKEFLPNAETLQAVWEKVHVFLDAPGQKLQRIAV